MDLLRSYYGCTMYLLMIYYDFTTDVLCIQNVFSLDLPTNDLSVTFDLLCMYT